MEITAITIDSLKKIKKDNYTYKYILFGAGDMGKRLYDKLSKEGIVIENIWDNDVKKQNTFYHGTKIISYNDLKNNSDFIIIVGCNYVKQEERIEKLGGCKGIYSIIDREALEDYYASQRDYFDEFLREINKQVEFYNDELSKKTAILLADDIVNYKLEHGYGLSVSEEHYFVKEVIDYISDKSLVYVDCGAYMGELPLYLEKAKIKYDKCFCIEMDSEIFNKAKENIETINLSDKIEMICAGISEEEGTLYYELDGAGTRIVDYKTEHKAKIDTLDNLFKNETVGFIKMDIEGAELGALKGGINTILRDRPVLVISVYHSLRDRVEIPKYLHEKLGNYNFYLRHHSFGHAETVLYAIPN